MADAETIAPPETAPAPGLSLKDLSPTQLDKFMATGDLPDAPESPAGTSDTADASPATAATVDGPEPSLETPAESKAAKPLGKPRDDANARFGQLTEQKKAAIARAEAAERERDELKARLGTPAAPAPAAAVAPDDDKEPELDDFLDATKYPDAYAAHAKAVGKWAARQERREFERAQAQQAVYQSVQTRVQDVQAQGKAKHADWDLSPLATANLGVAVPPALVQFIYEHPSSVDLLYHFSKAPSEARDLAAMGELAAAARIGELAAQFSTPSPAASSPAPTRPALPKAPPPFLGSKPTSGTTDELAEALQARDVDRFIELENQKELADRKAGRR